MECLSRVEKSKIESGNHPVIEEIRARAYREVIDMAKVLDKPVGSYPFTEIVFGLKQLLDQTACLLNRGTIDPFFEIRTAPQGHPKPIIQKRLRIGIYPVAANPFHWAHLLIGLSALTEFKLDKIIYVISGTDSRKPQLVAPEIRHLIGEEVLKRFSPLFGYSSIAIDNNSDGETNVFKMLALNQQQEIDAFYIVGSDHYRRINPKTGAADTIQKLEDNVMNKICCFNEAMHSISVIFIERGTRTYFVETFLNVSFIPEILFAASSTMIREAFQGKRSLATLALLPCTAYRHAQELHLYEADYESTIRSDSRRQENKEQSPPSREGNFTTFSSEACLCV